METAELAVFAKNRIALGIRYSGSAYSGWQSQLSGNTVQDRLEHALSRFLGSPAPAITSKSTSTPSPTLRTLCAGRTDTRVHALQQVVHFDTSVERLPASWVRGTNAFLPKDIAVQWALPVSSAFHARSSATSRRYAYLVLESLVRPSVEAGRVGWVCRPLDGSAMRQALPHLLGTQDFSSFRAAQCQSHTPVKTLLRAEIFQRGNASAAVPGAPRIWRFEFEANAFLHHMVRNVMGCLLAIGAGAHPPGWLAEVIAAKSRKAAAPTFSPDGLYFLGPVYHPRYGIPELPASYDWLL